MREKINDLALVLIIYDIVYIILVILFIKGETIYTTGMILPPIISIAIVNNFRKTKPKNEIKAGIIIIISVILLIIINPRETIGVWTWAIQIPIFRFIMLPEKNKIISNEIEKKIDNMIETSKEEIMTVAFTCLIQAYFVTYIYPNETLKHALLAIITPLIGIGASRKGEITAITVYVVTFGLIMALNTEISAFFVGTAMINTANVSSIACNEIKKVNKKSKKTPIITIPIIIYMNISIIFFGDISQILIIWSIISILVTPNFLTKSRSKVARNSGIFLALLAAGGEYVPEIVIFFIELPIIFIPALNKCSIEKTSFGNARIVEI